MNKDNRLSIESSKLYLTIEAKIITLSDMVVSASVYRGTI